MAMCLWTFNVVDREHRVVVGALFTDIKTGEKTTSFLFLDGSIASIKGHVGELKSPAVVKKNLAGQIYFFEIHNIKN